MASTYGPQVTFDLPSGEAAAEHIRETLGLGNGEQVQWSKRNECPDDVRSALGDALRHEYGGWVNPWELLPREVRHDGARVRVTLAPLQQEYEDDGPEVQEGPRQRLLATLREYHHELGAHQVEEDALLEETPGDRATLREELAVLERQGEVYQPQPTVYRLTSASPEADR